ncbi:hypothetical protein CN97_19315 [Haematobacter massiliensis]|uniref:Uncharacterized protein n=1 Tax=Haematobacter massiliensis TaxID=195105 RepID=A0A086Y2E5_9RHOB|nr:hypothetical protein CN97_19315 [Haematobacter massiliensis]OWJ84648.1 hypothetical protein CDV51_13260 [Haematobacter massiliensis]
MLSALRMAACLSAGIASASVHDIRHIIRCGAALDFDAGDLFQREAQIRRLLDKVPPAARFGRMLPIAVCAPLGCGTMPLRS